MICIGLFVAFVVNGCQRRNTQKNMILSENVIFRGLRLSLDPFGQQAPESPVSQLQNGVSTSSAPPFIVDLLTNKDYPRSNSFFQWDFRGRKKANLASGFQWAETAVPHRHYENSTIASGDLPTYSLTLHWSWTSILPRWT